jgi:integrase
MSILPKIAGVGIEPRGDAYRLRVSNGRDSAGKQILERMTFNPDPNKTERQNMKELSEVAIDFLRKVKSGRYLSGEKLTYADYINEHWKPHAKEHLAATTYQADIGELERYLLPKLGHLRLSAILPLHINELYSGLSKQGLSAGTVRRAHSTLSSTLGSACKWGLIDSNPALKADPPKKEKSAMGPKCFDLDQTKAFLDFIERPYTVVFRGRQKKDGSLSKERAEEHTVPYQIRVLLNIGIFAALRRGEILDLRWADIDFDKGAISVNSSAARTKEDGQISKDPKNESSIRIVNLPPSVMAMLKRLKKEQNEYRLRIGSAWQGDDWLFTQWDGRQMCITTPNATLHKIIKRYNADSSREPLPDVCLHSTRHTSATLSIAAGMDIKSISARLGHSQTSTTLNVYAHALAEMDLKIANALEDMLAPVKSKNA